MSWKDLVEVGHSLSSMEGWEIKKLSHTAELLQVMIMDSFY
jgi:hypothetical protein